MKTKKFSLSLILYELRNVGGEWYVYFFGLLLPIMLSIFISKAYTTSVPEALIPEVNTEVMLTMTLVIPMSIMFIGYGSLCAQEVEKGIPLRMRLFGFPEKSVMAAKVIAHMIFMTAAFLIFGLVEPLILELEKPALSSVVCLLICLYVLGLIFLVMAHAIANLFGKFGPAYAVMMALYFFFMILSGMMGARIDQLPPALRVVAKILPMQYISNDFIDFWQGETYHFAPMIQSYLFLGAVAGILLLISLQKNKRAVY